MSHKTLSNGRPQRRSSGCYTGLLDQLFSVHALISRRSHNRPFQKLGMSLLCKHLRLSHLKVYSLGLVLDRAWNWFGQVTGCSLTRHDQWIFIVLDNLGRTDGIHGWLESREVTDLSVLVHFHQHLLALIQHWKRWSGLVTSNFSGHEPSTFLR